MSNFHHADSDCAFWEEPPEMRCAGEPIYIPPSFKREVFRYYILWGRRKKEKK